MREHQQPHASSALGCGWPRGNGGQRAPCARLHRLRVRVVNSPVVGDHADVARWHGDRRTIQPMRGDGDLQALGLVGGHYPSIFETCDRTQGTGSVPLDVPANHPKPCEPNSSPVEVDVDARYRPVPYGRPPLHDQKIAAHLRPFARFIEMALEALACQRVQAMPNN